MPPKEERSGGHKGNHKQRLSPEAQAAQEAAAAAQAANMVMLQKVCGDAGMPIYANPLRGMRDPAAFALLSPAEQRKAESRFERMLKSMDSSVSVRDQAAAVKHVADSYPDCAAENCTEPARFRCTRCLSTTQKYCSKECQKAHWLVHAQTCTSDTAGAARDQSAA